MTRHCEAIQRIEQSIVHEFYGRIKEARDVLEPPYEGGDARFRQRYLQRRLDLDSQLNASPADDPAAEEEGPDP